VGTAHQPPQKCFAFLGCPTERAFAHPTFALSLSAGGRRRLTASTVPNNIGELLSDGIINAFIEGALVWPDAVFNSAASAGRDVFAGIGQMAVASRDKPAAVSAVRGRNGDASRPDASRPHEISSGFDGEATYHFEGRVEGLSFPSLSPAQQAQFKADFGREIARLNAWAIENNWLPAPPAPHLRIFVSDEYKISKALLPVSTGQRGRMEFPAWKIVAGEAAIMHELVHVYYPNGNRLLAEGLAVHLQAHIGANFAFPDFGRPLHDLARDQVKKMLTAAPGEFADRLDEMRLGDLDKIATPSPLRLRVGLNLYQDDAGGPAHLYPVAGSFLQFLIDSEGIDKLRAVYLRTPLRPFERDAGSLERWMDAYGKSFGELEKQWKSQLFKRPCATQGQRPARVQP
jgi:hypothetical protein